ncbi:glycosyltransferase [Carnobacterium maltaromaticum]|uniref:glycosyltransferase n=1 Tax=Carnobacterium maltaromaticum TaxID=2751 RepID=UPI0039B0F85B
MRQLNVLLYGDVDLNFTDGSAVWLTSMAKVLAESANIQVDVLLKSKIRSSHLISEMENFENVTIIDTFSMYKEYQFQNKNRMNVSEAVDIMNQRDQENTYHLIIVRGLDLVNKLMEEKRLVAKTIPYITNFEYNPTKSTIKERKQLKQIYRKFPKLFMQTKEMKEIFSSLIKENGNKIELLYPMIPNINKQPTFKNNGNKIIYSGKFAEDWYTEEMLDIVEALDSENYPFEFMIAGDKFQGALTNKKESIVNRFNSKSKLKWYGAVSRERSQELMSQADIGFGLRSETIDNDQSVELSTKLLEYGSLGIPVLCRPTKMHRELFGEDYPFFVTNSEECKKKIKEAFNKKSLYENAAKMVFDAIEFFTFSSSYQRLKNVFWSFQTEPIKLLVAGHDLKFLTMALTAWKKNPDFQVRIDKWKGHNKHDSQKSEELLKWADMIFCEWGLGSAVWYSKNKLANQKLIIRMHAQEKDTAYPDEFNYSNIDRIITVSPFSYEVFMNRCQLPREKMMMIYNMIDTKKYALPKKNETKFNLGLVGILPKLKRLDLAIDIIEELVKINSKYKLYIRSKMPQDLLWMKNRPAELAYYEKQFDRIENTHLKEHVIFDKHGSDMESWFQKIGHTLSVSDAESFHLAPMEGMASGAYPYILNWEGAETIYPASVVMKNTHEIVERIENMNNTEIIDVKRYPQTYFDSTKIIYELSQLILDVIKE